MPILAANSSLVLTLTPGQRLSFLVGSGTLQVVPPEPANIGPVFLPIQVGQSVGPWDVTVQYLMRTTQETDYSIFDPAQVPALWSSAAGTALVRPNGSVAPVSSQTVTWATRPTSPSLFDQIFATDIGPNGAYFQWNGTRWKVLYPSVIAETSTLVAGVAQTADQYFTAARLGPFPLGLFGVGDVLQYHIGLGKAGTTDTFTALSIRVGQNGAIGDSAVLQATISSFMTAAARSGGIEKWMRIESATTIRGLGVNNANSSWNNVNISGTAADATQTIPNITTVPLFVGLSTTMSGATDAPQIAYQRLTLYP